MGAAGVPAAAESPHTGRGTAAAIEATPAARVYWLGTGDWQLCEKAGGAYLVKPDQPKSHRLAGDNERRWYVSTPTIRTASGKFLATDPAGRDPGVCLVREKGDNTRWTPPRRLPAGS